MGFDKLLPMGDAEAKAFAVFMKKYIKIHPDQDDEQCLWNGRNAWGKLTKEQKKAFAVKPKSHVIKRTPIPKKKRLPKVKVGRIADPRLKRLVKDAPKKKKQAPKSKAILGRPPKPHGRKLTNHLAEKTAQKLTKKLEKKIGE